MDILYVEFNTTALKENLINVTQAAIPNVKISDFQSKETAIEFCRNNLIDVFIISLDGFSNEDGGNALIIEAMGYLQEIINIAPHTPVYFIGSSELNIQITNQLLSSSHHVDVWGDRASSPTIKVLSKDDLDYLLQELIQISTSLIQLEGITINSGGTMLSLSPVQKRILRIFARKFKGKRCYVKSLDAGLSGSRVLQLEIKDMNDASRVHAIAKLDDIKNIDIEVNNYYQDISRLPVRAYAPQVGTVKGETSNSAGVFYRLLKPSDVPLFKVATMDDDRATQVVIKLRELLDSWYSNSPIEIISIGSIREKFLSNQEVSGLSEKYNLDWIQEIERIEVNARKSCIHGDLHGENIFVSDNNEPVIIDFGDVGEGHSVLDPITLELSLFTHPSVREKLTWQPDLEISSWQNLETYLHDCPYSNFIKECRNWSYSIAGDDLAVNAGAYGYLLRQLKYDDVDEDLILKLLLSIKESILS